MTPVEYRACLAALALTQNAAARFFGVHHVTGRRWAALNGEGPPGSVAKLLLYMLAQGLTPEQIDRAIARKVHLHSLAKGARA